MWKYRDPQDSKDCSQPFGEGDKNLLIWISAIRGWLNYFFLVKFLKFWKSIMFPLKSMIDNDIVKWPSSPTQNKNSIQSKYSVKYLVK